jgi:hypothetical protein
MENKVELNQARLGVTPIAVRIAFGRMKQSFALIKAHGFYIASTASRQLPNFHEELLNCA